MTLAAISAQNRLVETTWRGIYPLRVAAEKGDVAAVEKFIEENPLFDQTWAEIFKCKSILEEASICFSPQVFSSLLNSGKCNSINGLLASRIIYYNSVKRSYVKPRVLQIIKILAASSAVDLNEKDPFGSTPLHEAVKLHEIEILQTLILNPNTDVNAQTYKGETALFHAARVNNLQAVRLLLEETLNNSFTDTPLEKFQKTLFSISINFTKLITISK